MAVVQLQVSTSTTPVQLYTGITQPVMLLVSNPTPVSGGPAVTGYISTSPFVTPLTAEYQVLPGTSVCVPLYGWPLYAVAQQYGILTVNVTA